MGSNASTDYCAFTKAIEHLGDRWSLLIVRELKMFGPQGFNSLAAGLPGRISRSVLAGKLRKLEELGIVARDPSGSSRQAPYRLAPAGEELVPTLMSLHSWAEHWVPEDPAMAARDPTVIAVWLRHRVNRSRLPERQVALELSLGGTIAERCWLLLAQDAEPSLCLEDPALDQERYVYVEGDATGLYQIARGVVDWTDAIRARSVDVYGDPELVGAMPSWFKPVEPAAQRPSPHVAVA